MAPRYKLKLKQLDFISAVDTPAQETATALLVKRAPHRRKGSQQPETATIEGTARVVKTSDELGLVFGWALTTKANGADYFDLHGDNIVEEDLIRVAAEFMEKGGDTDQQHDYARDGKVVFAMPLTAEVAKSFGIETDTHGLMIAMKPSPEVFAKFKSGEYTGFSIAGLGEREQVSKSHGYAPGERIHVAAEKAHMEGAFGPGTVVEVNGNALGIVFDSMPGVVHRWYTLDEVTSLEAETETDGEKRKKKPMAGMTMKAAGVCLCGGAASASASKSTRAEPTSKVSSKMETKIIVLTDAQHAHYAKLAGAEADAFLSKSSAERDAVLADIAKADAVVFKGELTGIEVRKSHGPMAMQLAELAEKNAAVTKAQAETIAKRDEAIEKAEIRKTAAETLGNLTGGDEVHDLIIRSLRKSGAKAEDIGAALEAMKGWNTLAGKAGVAKGENPGKDAAPANAEQAFVALEKGLLAFAKSKNITNLWTEGLAAFVQTEEGAALKRAHDDARTNG